MHIVHIQIGLPDGSVVKKKKVYLPMQETWVQLLGQEDPLEKETATHSRILAWRIPCREEPGGLQSVGVAKSGTQLSNQTTTAILDLQYCVSFRRTAK